MIHVTDEEKGKSAEAEAGRAEGEGEKAKGDREDRLLGRDIPPANFYALVTTFQIPAMQFLGELKDPSTEKVDVHPSLAKYYIDCLSILDEKTRGNLTEEEKKTLDGVLTQLRLSYVKVAPGGEGEKS